MYFSVPPVRLPNPSGICDLIVAPDADAGGLFISGVEATQNAELLASLNI